MFGWLKGSGKTPAAQRQAITCVEIKISGAPQSTRLCDGVAIPRHRRDVVPVAASARWRGGSRDNLTHWLTTQALRDAAKAPKGTTTEARSPVKRRNTAPAFSREQCRRDRAMMSSSFRRRGARAAVAAWRPSSSSRRRSARRSRPLLPVPCLNLAMLCVFYGPRS